MARARKGQRVPGLGDGRMAARLIRENAILTRNVGGFDKLDPETQLTLALEVMVRTNYSVTAGMRTMMRVVEGTEARWPGPTPPPLTLEMEQWIAATRAMLDKHEGPE